MRSAVLVPLLEPGGAPVVVAVALAEPLFAVPPGTAVHGCHSMIPLFELPTGSVPRAAGKRHLGQDTVVAEAVSSPGPLVMSVRTLHANWSSRVTGDLSTMSIIVWKSCSGISSDNRTVRCR
jgi:hypothetical protein